jgi:hypothetical protein
MSSERDARLEALAADFEIEFEFLELAVQEGAVRADELRQEAHSAAALARLRRLQRLCASLDLDLFAASIIVDLLERLEAAQRDIERRRIEG